MLESMTGFGQAEGTINGLSVKAEIKSLNSKFLDTNIKMSRELNHLENEVRSLLQQELKRGKVNLQLEVSGQENEPAQINEELLKAYFKKYMSLCNELGSEHDDLFKLALHSPDVISTEGKSVDISWEELRSVLTEAIKGCQDFRTQEGASLQAKLTEYIQSIRESLGRIETLDKKRIENIRTRIGKNLDDLREKVQVDENRFEQELIYYIEKLDITEEKVRLDKHLSYFDEVINSKNSEGKKLGFISQEIGREINTIGSKANDSDIQQVVVEMKDELEKIKEQLLNIL